MWKKVLLFIVIVLLHFSLEFISWSSVPGNATVETSGVFTVLWYIFSFPLITCLPAGLVNAAFMPILIANSCMWVGVIFGIAWFIKRKKVSDVS